MAPDELQPGNLASANLASFNLAPANLAPANLTSSNLTSHDERTGSGSCGDWHEPGCSRVRYDGSVDDPGEIVLDG